MPRAKKDQQKGQILKKTTVLCPSRKYYSIIRVKEGGGGGNSIREQWEESYAMHWGVTVNIHQEEKANVVIFLGVWGCACVQFLYFTLL